MGSFFTGLATAIVLAIAVGVGLNSWELSSAETFSTKEAQL